MSAGGGRILVLNGTSSAGKTTLANALRQALPDEYEVVGLDQTLRALPSELFVITEDVDHAPVDGFLIPLRDGAQVAIPTLGPAALDALDRMYASFGARAGGGANLIVDDVMWHPRALGMAIAHLTDRDAWLIGVYCPTDVAVEREKRRGDRAAGGAALFEDAVHRHGVYDITVDTSLLTPQEAARQVMAAMGAARGPTAFRRLRSERSTDAH
jgi:chloramphenicol 3-O phosphotransferase